MNAYTQFDLVIRNGSVVDGSGSEPFRADVAVNDGVIIQVGVVEGSGTEEIDAAGMLVTPGFVDIHTHYDGQVTWAERLSPSTAHGVTTVVMGNCGVGFAPCRPADRDVLIKLMEGVEDIPGAVMAEGIPWEWETFPEFLDFLAARKYDADVAAYLPHAPLRVYVMGQRGLDREPATTADMQRMGDLAKEAMTAGALGVATSRSLNHRSSDHHLLPGVSAAEGELVAIGAGLRRGGAGLLQLIADFDEPESDFAMLRRVAEKTGLPLMFSLMQVPHAPTRWRTLLDLVEKANQDGVNIKSQVFPRPVASIVGLKLHFNPFTYSPSYVAIAHLPLAERLAVLRDPETRRRIIAEYPTVTLEPASGAFKNLANFYLMGDEPNYEPDPADSVAALAIAKGLRPVDLAYDLLLENDGANVFYAPALNFADGNLDAVGTMLRHKDTLVGLGDGGAHVGIICDASGQTTMLMRWIGDGSDGTMPVGEVIEALTSANARAVNLLDRGLVAPGYRADLNVIELNKVKLHRPEMIYDLPLGSGRLIQRADGYRATIVGGKVTYRDGVATGELPGRLVRGARQSPVDGAAKATAQMALT
jgi:N-acyl-D-aspartate/D-glutamate deacylase